MQEDTITEFQAIRLAKQLNTSENIIQAVVPSKQIAGVLISTLILKFLVERMMEEVWRTKKMITDVRLKEILAGALSTKDPRFEKIKLLLSKSLR